MLLRLGDTYDEAEKGYYFSTLALSSLLSYLFLLPSTSSLCCTPLLCATKLWSGPITLLLTLHIQPFLLAIHLLLLYYFPCFLFLLSSFSSPSLLLLLRLSLLRLLSFFPSSTHLRYAALKQQGKAKEWYQKAAEMPFKGVAEEQLHKDAVSKAK